jgi:outer membrane protein TolC
MRNLLRIERALRWIGLAGVFMTLPACTTAPVTAPSPIPSESSFAELSPGTQTSSIAPVSGQVNSEVGAKSSVSLPSVPSAADQGKPLPINLPTALALSGANPIDVQLAGERLQAAAAALDRANVLWLPSISLGVDYFRHDGQIQDVAGTVFTTSRSSLLLGGGPNAVFSVGDAIYAPLVARQVVQARQAEAQVARNDTTLRVAVAYFTVQQARGEVAGAIESLRRAEELVSLAKKLGDFAPSVEVNRARVEAARRRQAVETAYDRWQEAAAELTRILRLEPGTLVEPAEEPALKVELIDPKATTDQLITIALTNRPELAAHQAIIQAAIARVQQESVRPFIPTVALRGVGSQVPGLAGGYFGGGINDDLSNFGPRFSVDLQAVWELQNLGLGNRALIREREAESRQALLQLIRAQDSVTAEVVQAHSRVKRAANRLTSAAEAVADAAETADKNLKGLIPGKRVGDQLVLLFRPQEAVAAVAALDLAYRDYYQTVADHNRAQYQLYRALGHPSQCLVREPHSPPTPHDAEIPAATPQPMPATIGMPVSTSRLRD